MRILPLMPHPEGYEPSSVELNHDEAVLDISSQPTSVLIEETQLIAETIILRCVLKPLPLNDKSIKAQLISEGEALEEVPLYDEQSLAFGYELEAKNSQWKGIALEYTGIGWGIHQGNTFYFEGENLTGGYLEMHSPLYLKPFQIEKKHHYERATTLASGEILRSPPGILNAQVLRGYGGYYKEGVALEEIQQIFYSLTSASTQTRVRLFSSTKLQEQRTPPPHGGKSFNHEVVFSPQIQEENYLSLPGAIAAGYAQLILSTDEGTTHFKSYLCESVAGSPTFVKVYFHP